MQKDMFCSWFYAQENCPLDLDENGIFYTISKSVHMFFLLISNGQKQQPGEAVASPGWESGQKVLELQKAIVDGKNPPEISC